ncbi:right-handed parallel beta-helix repeat-containing protein [bacterium]|nr:right-handed parallel beta-helix repeat-containing protein [bacterium]
MKRFTITTLICLMIIVGAAWGEVIYVDADAEPGGDGSEEHPFNNIQDGIDASSDGDTVLVADGTYSVPDTSFLDFKGKAIIVESADGPIVTIIDCGGSIDDLRRGFYFHTGEGRDSIVSGFTIKNGVKYRGGAIACDKASSPTIENNIIIDNKAIPQSTASGVEEVEPIVLDLEPTVLGAKGGAILCNASSSPIIINNIIINNKSEDVGGAIVCAESSSPDIINNIIAGNEAMNNGGAIGCFNASSPKIIYNTITQNSTTGKSGGIISKDGCSPEILNTIIWGDISEQGNEILVDAAEITISYSDVMGGEEGIIGDPDFIYWGEGNITMDPLLLIDKDPLLDPDYLHLTDYSPCIGAGIYTPDITKDIDGEPRPANPDMGADENARQTPLPRGDVSGNEIVTAFDASLVLQHVVGLINLSEGQFPKGAADVGADVTGNKVVSALDAALILQHTVGIITMFPVEYGIGAPILNAKSENELLADAINTLEEVSLDRKQREVIKQLNRYLVGNILPTHTNLLQNYPNPFNPETWLPYQLAQDALVKIRIYNAKGQLIRSLRLGTMQAGSYITKERAAYWDGLNNLGQRVASGVYFYTMQVEYPKGDAIGKYTETRRMVILK